LTLFYDLFSVVLCELCGDKLSTHFTQRKHFNKNCEFPHMGPIKNTIRHFNKHVLNPIMGNLAGAPIGPVALVRHKGRSSGKQYATPILVFPIEDGFLVALTYGPQVDWYKNVKAADQCGIRWHGTEYTITHIEPLPRETALPQFPQPEKTILRLLNIDDYVKMLF
jgi:deazaflavin-dependent oxidoreductase (nitroreductase family)